ncbi:MAG: 4Fe-4S dicluster domain-containing protein [Desulfovibrio sp.]|nr:4Fe-4S dicluster domain-containing protein [Desulfovibrio sp.]
MNRRKFLAFLGSSGVVSALASVRVAEAAPHVFPYNENSFGVLHDTTRCIGCRRCEAACQAVNNLPMPEKPFTDLEVTNERRRVTAKAWTVVNKYEVNGQPFFRKLQCFHCNDPACAAACFTKCYTKLPDGAVVYDGSQCVGCRYCMVACPFNVPGFQYNLAWDPLVLKCTFCEPLLKQGKLPACVSACPVDAITFGRRSDLIRVARRRFDDHPGKYMNYIYGEHDAGGTAWMVLAPAAGANPGPVDNPDTASKEFKQLGLDTHLGNQPMAELTYGALGAVPMIVAFWPVLFGGAYAITKRREAIAKASVEEAAKSAKDDITAAMDAAIRKIEETEGQAAADRARRAMTEALKARESQDRQGEAHNG